VNVTLSGFAAFALWLIKSRPESVDAQSVLELLYGVCRDMPNFEQ